MEEYSLTYQPNPTLAYQQLASELSMDSHVLRLRGSQVDDLIFLQQELC